MKYFNIIITIPVLFLFGIYSTLKTNKETFFMMEKAKHASKSNVKVSKNIGMKSVRANNLKSLRVNKRYLTDLSKIQNTFQNSNKNFFTNEEPEIKDYGAIYMSNDGKNFEITNDKNFKTSGKKVVEMHFHKTLFEKGWDKLSITTHKPANAYVQSYLAGYIEGRATAMDIFNFYDNLRHNTKQKQEFKQMREFFKQVAASMQKKIKNIDKVSNEDAQMWLRMLLGYTQLEGLINGYTNEMKRLNKYDKEEYKLDLADFLILQADGEVPELLTYFRSFRVKAKIGDKDYFKDAFGIDTEDPKEFWTRLMWTSKCSAFIKLTKDNKGMWKDLLVGHTTWTDFYELIRSYKHYKFEFEGNEDLPLSEMTFSSYPGCLSSTDDFFITNHNLVITETTIEIIDISHYKNVKTSDKYIPNYMRVLAASRFAKSAKEWCKMFSVWNSGTYSSQWMILDYNVFKQIKGTNKPVNNMIYMMEQTPDKIVSHDISHYMEKHSYFGSYNRAFFKTTKDSLDDALITNLYGNTFTYKGASRRKIINNLADKVHDLKSIKEVLRWNGYRKASGFKDPSSKDPSKGISSRSDLSSLVNLSGGVDSKVTNEELVFKMSAVAISGPTTDNNENLPVFDWKVADPKNSLKRVGVPEKFDFPYILVSPKTLCCDNKNDIYSFDDKHKK